MQYLLLHFKESFYDKESNRDQFLFFLKAHAFFSKIFWICGFFELIWFIAFDTESESGKNNICFY